MNGYFPQGESRDHPTKFPAKEKFYADLQSLLLAWHGVPRAAKAAAKPAAVPTLVKS